MTADVLAQPLSGRCSAEVAPVEPAAPRPEDGIPRAPDAPSSAQVRQPPWACGSKRSGGPWAWRGAAALPRLGSPESVSRALRPWPAELTKPSVLRRLPPLCAVPAPCSGRAAPHSARRAEEVHSSSSEELESAIRALERTGEDFDQVKEHSDPLPAELEAWAARMRAAVGFLRTGGDVPEPGKLRHKAFPAGGFAFEVHSGLQGGFLLTKNSAGPRRPYRALYSVEGVAQGQVGLRRLRALCPSDEPEERRLAAASKLAPGGWAASPAETQRTFRFVPPGVLAAWAWSVLYGEGSCLKDLQVRLRALQRAEEFVEVVRNTGARRAKIDSSTHPWNKVARGSHAVLLRALWSALWEADLKHARQLAELMTSVGLDVGEPLFHEVVVSRDGTPPVRYAAVEPAGIIRMVPDRRWGAEMGVQFVRRHYRLTPVAAYECMRLDSAAPPGCGELLEWLQQATPAAAREPAEPPALSSHFFKLSPDRDTAHERSTSIRAQTEADSGAVDSGECAVAAAEQRRIMDGLQEQVEQLEEEDAARLEGELQAALEDLEGLCLVFVRGLQPLDLSAGLEGVTSSLRSFRTQAPDRAGDEDALRCAPQGGGAESTKDTTTAESGEGAPSAEELGKSDEGTGAHEDAEAAESSERTAPADDAMTSEGREGVTDQVEPGNSDQDTAVQGVTDETEPGNSDQGAAGQEGYEGAEASRASLSAMEVGAGGALDEEGTSDLASARHAQTPGAEGDAGDPSGIETLTYLEERAVAQGTLEVFEAEAAVGAPPAAPASCADDTEATEDAEAIGGNGSSATSAQAPASAEVQEPEAAVVGASAGAGDKAARAEAEDCTSSSASEDTSGAFESRMLGIASQLGEPGEEALVQDSFRKELIVFRVRVPSWRRGWLAEMNVHQECGMHVLAVESPIGDNAEASSGEEVVSLPSEQDGIVVDFRMKSSTCFVEEGNHIWVGLEQGQTGEGLALFLGTTAGGLRASQEVQESRMPVFGWKAPGVWEGQTLLELDLRASWGIAVVAVQAPGEEPHCFPPPDAVVLRGSIVYFIVFSAGQFGETTSMRPTVPKPLAAEVQRSLRVFARRAVDKVVRTLSRSTSKSSKSTSVTPPRQLSATAARSSLKVPSSMSTYMRKTL